MDKVSNSLTISKLKVSKALYVTFIDFYENEDGPSCDSAKC